MQSNHLMRNRSTLPPEDLADRIHRLAFGRIRHLRVFHENGRVILEGETRTYHAKQLAQEAVLDLTDGRLALANRIEVR